MIKAKKILRLIRNKVKDNNEVQFSDYDVLDAMNECIRYLNMNYALKNSDFLERVKKYRQDEMGIVFSTDGAELPEDFVSLVSVIRARDGYHLSPVTAGEDMDKHKLQSIGGYKVFAGKIYCSLISLYLLPIDSPIRSLCSNHARLKHSLGAPNALSLFR